MTGPVITGQELRAIISEAYPRAYTPAIDRRYFLPSEDFVRKQVIEPLVKGFAFRPEISDCDDIALILVGRAREMQARERWGHPLALGFALGTLKTGQNHATNIAVTDRQEVVWLDHFRHDMAGFRPRLIVV